MLTYFRPRIKDQGSHIIYLQSYMGTVTANTTTSFGIGSISDKDDTANAPGHTGYIDELLMSCVTIPADSDGTILLNVIKYDASAAAAVTLATSFDLEALVALQSERIPFDTLTDSQRILDFGDFLYATVVNNSAAINTQMIGGVLTVAIKLLT